MTVLLLGPGSDSFTTALDDAGIEYQVLARQPQPGVIMNASGDVLQFVGHVVPWASIASVLVAWLRARASRKIIVTTKGNKVVRIEGYSVEEFQQILADAREIAVIDTKKSDVKK
jgi:hypothetical protein